MNATKSTLVYRIIFTVLLFAVALYCSCSKSRTGLRYEYSEDSGAGFPYPETYFAVISDIHIYDPSLGSSGAAFLETLNSDRKLLLDSMDLTDYAIEAIKASGAGFVLVTGDLTKDGELNNHRLIAGKLKRFVDAGMAVYVIPGNHDINNPGAVRYEGDETVPVPSISAAEFAQIYGDFGYNSALMRDDDSLSYVAEPEEGLWLLALDSCRYRENKSGEEEIVSGKISQKTADWTAGVLQTATERKKAVIAMMHHGIVEHWNGQHKLHPDYLIDDYEDFGKFLSSHNVRFAFTGHYHALDIVLGQFGDKFIYDIETGSLVTAPCPIRYVEFKGNSLQVRTDTIVDKIHPGTNFAADGRAFVKKTVMLEAEKILRGYRVSARDAEYIANAVGDAFDAHYAGDENPALRPSFDRGRLGLWGRFVYGQQKYALDGLWEDLRPADNNVSLNF